MFFFCTLKHVIHTRLTYHAICPYTMCANTCTRNSFASSFFRQEIRWYLSIVWLKKSRWNQPVFQFFKCHDLELFYTKSQVLEILSILLITSYRSFFISVLFLIRSWKHQVVGSKIWKTSWDLILTFLSREA